MAEQSHGRFVLAGSLTVGRNAGLIIIFTPQRAHGNSPVQTMRLAIHATAKLQANVRSLIVQFIYPS